jgi:aminoglycoside 6'-N-acetyltransferase I
MGAIAAFSIRSARKEDTLPWVRMRVALWPDYDETWHRDEADKYFAGLLRMPLEVLIAVDDSGRAIGFVELSIRPYAEGCMTERVAYLEGWYVDPQVQRRGVGRALIDAAEHWARRQGCTEFGSDAVLDNLASAAAHAALGFEETVQVRCFRKALGDTAAAATSAADIEIREAAPDDIAKLRDEVRRGLMAFNVSNVGPDNFQELAIAARDRSGRVVGGLYGNTAWRWLFVDLLWVDAACRQQGLGGRLLHAAESAAQARGCTHAYLDTFDFQARPFYERAGYVVFGTQEGYPPGHRKFYLAKALPAASSS